MEAKSTREIERGNMDSARIRQWGCDDDSAHLSRFSGFPEKEEVWALTRRFNKQIFRARVIKERPMTALDMNVVAAGKEDATPERLLAHLERLYMTFVVDLFCFYKQTVRLRSWNEKPRTTSFLAFYSIAWLVDLLTPTLTAFLIVLIIYPPARDVCFPPAPPALIDSSGGGIRVPMAGQLASDSVTGASERHPGEAIEQEAHSFIESIGKLMMSLSVGKPEGKGRENELDNMLDPTKVVEGIAVTQDNPSQTKVRDETKEPVAQAVDNFEVFAAMNMLPDFIDSWERFGNALSPTFPFPLHRRRMTLAACLLPLLMILCFATWHAILKCIGFLIGFGFFGGKPIALLLTRLETMFPGWRQFLEMRHTIFRGVPTNSQLTVALLRVGERAKCPFSPPPSKSDRPTAKKTLNGKELEFLGTSNEDIRAAIDPHSDDDEFHGKPHKREKRSKMMSRLAGTITGIAKGGACTAVKIDQVTAWAGGNHAKTRIGALDAPEQDEAAGPVDFSARYRGNRGYAYITTTATSPALSWRSETDDLSSAWTVALADITELHKVDGLEWKSKFAVGAVLGWPVADGLLVKTRKGKEYHLTAAQSRDALFNLLISVGDQLWETF
ncbi:hypothetical protein HIM_09896 [Hirsutella minnesotensis 3608]|uniref:Uncharacterized protein n=1 Tax=Hirsutella minnesotensis 3608 TaxID=1043627 RepID=A0A0F7ZXH1_9HYPO|nr:hypothetical protein HIM_09896 [Hirsutella minnesotensis 3608]